MPGLEPPTVITTGYGGALAGRNSAPTNPSSRTSNERTAGSISILTHPTRIAQPGQAEKLCHFVRAALTAKACCGLTLCSGSVVKCPHVWEQRVTSRKNDAVSNGADGDRFEVCCCHLPRLGVAAGADSTVRRSGPTHERCRIGLLPADAGGMRESGHDHLL